MRAISLKIDFKFDEQGHLRIIDLGDGLSCGLGGFEESTNGSILRDWYELSGANSIVSLLGELPREVMQPETLHLPLISRSIPVSERLTHTEDLAARDERLILASGCHRNTAYQSYFWEKKGLKNTATIPLGLIATEMHKVLWYTLMEMHLSEEARPAVLYWCNDQSPDAFDFETLFASGRGLFIKIGDRSTGGANEVYYVKNQREARRVLQELYHTYTETSEKHIFIIEPAYVTMKGAYNATGRAFITLQLDEETQALHLKIAGAKWILPQAPFAASNTKTQMLANVNHASEMLDLEPTEIERLSRSIVDVYGDAFRAGLNHDNLIIYCQSHPIMPAFQACLRRNAAYLLLLNSLAQETPNWEAGQGVMASLLITHMLRDHQSSLVQMLSIEYESGDMRLFSSPQSTQKMINCICHLSLFERYVTFLKTYHHGGLAQEPMVADVVAKERRITLKLNAWIVSYLKMKDKSYDTKDLARALRQACVVSDLVVIKLLIFTHRADVNACSPKTKQTPLDFAHQSLADETIKAHALNILRHAGAKTSAELVCLQEGEYTPGLS